MKSIWPRPEGYKRFLRDTISSACVATPSDWGAAQLHPPATVDICICPAPTEEEEQYWAAVDAAKDNIDQRVERLRAEKPRKHPSCGRRSMAFRMKENPGQFRMARVACGRLDCPKCRRDAIVKSLQRVRQVRPSSAAGHPVLYVRRASWSEWASISRAIRRAADRPGHARVRLADGGVFVASAVRFPGSKAVAFAASVSQLADAIEQAATVRHNSRLLGAWAPPKEEDGESSWEVGKPRAGMEWARELVRERGVAVVDVPGIDAGWSCRLPDDAPAETVGFVAWLLGFAESCPTLAIQETRVGSGKGKDGHAPGSDPGRTSRHSPGPGPYTDPLAVKGQAPFETFAHTGRRADPSVCHVGLSDGQTRTASVARITEHGPR